MRPWWQDLLITTGGGALGTVIAAGAIAVAGKMAGLFDSSVEFKPLEFIRAIAAIIAAAATIAGIVPFVVSLFH